MLSRHPTLSLGTSNLPSEHVRSLYKVRATDFGKKTQCELKLEIGDCIGHPHRHRDLTKTFTVGTSYTLQFTLWTRPHFHRDSYQRVKLILCFIRSGARVVIESLFGAPNVCLRLSLYVCSRARECRASRGRSATRALRKILKRQGETPGLLDRPVFRRKPL